MQANKNHAQSGGAATVRVWDRFIRFFHWSLVLGFATAFISGELHAAAIHVLAGYALSALLVARVYWGIRGREYARFRSFAFPPGEALTYMRSMLKGEPKHYFGHNPAGALMVFALLGLLALIFVSGLLTLGTIDFEGPLVFLANRVSDETSYAFRHIHELLPVVGLVAVSVHLVGVIAGSILHKENLVKAMITGRKQSPAPSIPNNS